MRHNFFFIFVRGRHGRIHVCTSLSLSCLTSLTYLSLLISCCQYDFTFNRLCTTITELCGLTLSLILGLTRLANSMSGNLSYNAHAWSSAGAGCKVNSSVSLWCQQLSKFLMSAAQFAHSLRKHIRVIRAPRKLVGHGDCRRKALLSLCWCAQTKVGDLSRSQKQGTMVCTLPFVRTFLLFPWQIIYISHIPVEFRSSCSFLWYDL